MLIHQSDNSVSNVYHTKLYHGIRIRLHFHRGYEIVHVLHGKAELTVDGKSEMLHQGDSAMLLSNQIHKLDVINGSSVWICGFSTDFLPDFHKKVKNCVGDEFVFHCDPLLLSYFEKHLFPYEDHEGKLLDKYRLKGALYLLCSVYLATVALSGRDRSQSELMNTISDFIEKNYSSKLNLQDVATELGYEYSYFSRLFRKVFSVPFPEYLNSYRCGAAVEMIRSTDQNLSAIAKKSGFQSIRTFNSVFQKQMGMTPTEYMKQLKNRDRSV